nr:TniB family NTP-binding protein [Shewanella maritima]
MDHYKAKSFAQEFTSTQRPVLVTRISAKRDLDNTLVQMLYDLDLFGASQYRRLGFGPNLEQKLVDALKLTKTELIIINEFQKILEYKSEQERQAIGNLLKYISEEAQVPIAFVGTPLAAQICEDPQWASRLIRRRRLKHFCFKDINERRYYLSYLKGLASRMPVEFPPDLASPPFAIPLFAATRGENRYIKTLLQEALILALQEKNNTVSLAHLSAAYTSLVSEGVNVFELPFEQLKLIEIETTLCSNSDMKTLDQAATGTQHTKPMNLNDILSVK